MTYSKLGADWVLGPDGLRWRRAARVLLIDNAPAVEDVAPPGARQPAGLRSEPKVLLIRGHDADQPSRSWWFAVGGGIDPGETPHQAAVREVREETGIELESDQVLGPVATRSAIFDFFAESCRQDEEFFVAYLPGCSSAPALETTDHRAGWTEVEHELLDEVAWLTPAQLRAQPLEYFPPNLPDLVEQLAGGWTGAVAHLGEQDDDHLGRDSLA